MKYVFQQVELGSTCDRML